MRTLLAIAAALAATPAFAQPEPAPDGKALYAEHCALCHNQRGHASNLMGKRLGPERSIIETRAANNAQFIAFVVRHGLGSMPPLRRAELSDAELKAMTDYLTQPQTARQGTRP